MQISIIKTPHFQIWLDLAFHSLLSCFCDFNFAQFLLSICDLFACAVMPGSATWPYFYYMWSTVRINLIVTFWLFEYDCEMRVEACGDEKRVRQDE